MSLLVRRRVESRSASPGNPLTYIGSVELTAASNAVEFLVPEEHQNDKMFLVDATLIIPNSISIYPCPRLNENTNKTYMAQIHVGTIHCVFYIVPAPTGTNKGIVYSGGTSGAFVTGAATPLTKIKFVQYYAQALFSAGSMLKIYSMDPEQYIT